MRPHEDDQRDGHRGQGSMAGRLHQRATAPALPAQNYEVRLKRAWVRAVADRTTVDVTMDVRHTHHSAKHVKSGGDDGDIHFSGVSAGIGLPFVAEVVNAGLAAQRPAVDAIIAAEENDDDIEIGGAWRLWFEHPAKKQTQGGSNPFEPDQTNPDHSFEIHPASRINQLDLTGSFIPIAGYTAYAAEVAFPYFDQRKVTIKASSSGISLRSGKLKYNHVEFEIELTHDPARVQDGYIALAKVLDDNGDDVAAGPRRMIFVAGTRGAEVMRTASAGDRFRALGVPRVNLSAVLALVEQHGTRQFEAALPYEMIVVGVM